MQFDVAVAHALPLIKKTDIVLKPEEVQAIHHTYQGRDVFLWLLTGSGKSVCYKVRNFLLSLSVALQW